MVNLNKVFIVTLLFSTFLAFFVNFGFLAYGPFLFLGFFLIFFQFFNNQLINRSDVITLLGVTPFVVLCFYSYILNPYLGQFFNTHLIVLMVIYPLIIAIGSINKLNDKERIIFLSNILNCFLLMQVFICLGQALNYIVGFGLYIPEEFRESKMIPGTFANANDLATVLVLILYAIIGIEKQIDHRKFIYLIVLVFVLLFLCASRIAIVLSILLFTFRAGFNFYKLIKSFLIILGASILLIFLAKTIFSDSANRSLARLEAILDIAIYGFSSDNSASIRTSSYEFFFKNLNNLNFGSFEINNYSVFANTTESTYIYELMFQNPHSLIVEVGYWLGYLGLFLLFIFIYSLIKNHNLNKFLLFFILIILTCIPSSVLGNFIFFSFFILICNFKYPKHGEFKQ